MRFLFEIRVARRLPGPALVMCLVACGAGPADAELTPTERATSGGDTQAPHVTVALRVSLDGPAEQHRVHLHAVTYDMDGQQTSTDLGSYVGAVIQQPSVGADLIRIAIEDGDQQRSLRLVEHDGFIEARQSPQGAAADAEDELILRIPIRQGVRLRVNDPALELHPAP